MELAKVKRASVDFDITDLPATRWQVLRDVYRNRTPLLLDLGLLLMLFCLPIAAVCMLMLAQSADITQALTQNRITAAEASVQLIQIQNAGNVLLIPALVIFSLGLAGAANVIKNLVWQEGVLFKGDFRHGIRENWRCYALTAFLAGILHYVARYLLHISFFEAGTALELGLAAIVAASAIFALALPFLLIQSTLYQLGYAQKFINALLLSMRTFFPTLGLLLLHILPFGVLLIDNYTVYVFSLLLIPVLVLPTLILADTLYVHSILDRYINREHFPQIYRKGLRPDA